MSTLTKSQKPVQLGEISVPSGSLLILDPGLARFWRHDGEPVSPRKNEPQEHDLQITGPDAIAAGKEFDRQFDPRYLFDVRDVKKMEDLFEKFIVEKSFKAKLEHLPNRIPHTERAKLAAEIGNGAGVVHYNNMWAVVVSGLPTNRSLPIFATYMPDEGEFADRWRTIDIVIDATAQVAKSETTSGVMVEHGQLICADLDAFGEFRMWESLDGLADFVFWGPDAEDVAEKFKAERLSKFSYGWRNIPMTDVGHHAKKVQDFIEKNRAQVAVDYRPHCNLEKLNAQIRQNELESGHVTLKDAKICGFSNRWGDGIFDVIRDFDSKGNLIRIRLDVGNEQKQDMLRRLNFLALGAVVTKKILEDGEPIRFAERLEASVEDDSGWAFSSDTESDEYMEDPSNMAIVEVGWLLEKYPELKPIIDAPMYSAFQRTDNGFVLLEEDDD